MKVRKWIIYVLFVLITVAMVSQQCSIRDYKNDVQSVIETLSCEVNEKIDKLIDTTKEIKDNVYNLTENMFYLLLHVDPKPNIEKIKNATIQIKVGKAGGAGIVIEDNGSFLYALTAKHITERKGKVGVVVINTETNKKIVIKNINRKNIVEHKLVDLALVKIPRPEGKYEVLELAEKEPEVGKTIYTVGHPVGTYYTVNVGIVSNYIKNLFAKRKGTYMMVSAPSIFGNSGGAVVNNKSQVVGICSGIMWLGKNPKKIEKAIFIPHMTFTIRLNDIKDLMEKIK